MRGIAARGFTLIELLVVIAIIAQRRQQDADQQRDD
ncbi:MAG: prepilin-type N-terminal cleavage/methylation domain-containing protein, partial [Phycisphaerales bacterium JB039]